MLKIDVHAHYFPLDIIKEFKNKLNFSFNINSNKIKVIVGKNSWEGSAYNGFLNEEKLIEDLHNSEVDIRILSLAPISYLYDVDINIALSFYKKFNDKLSEISEKSKGKFMGIAGIPLQEPSIAVEELKRAVNDLGLKGVLIGTHILNWNLDDKKFEEFFQSVSSLNIPILIHPQITDIICSENLRNYYFTNLLGVPIEDTIAVASLIMSGMIEKYNLRVIVPQGGGFLPYQIGRIDHGYKVRGNSADLNKIPSDFLKNMYFDNIVFNTKVLEFLINFVGEDHVVLGSDYPFKMGYYKPYEIIEKIKISEEDKDKIAEKNARLLFHI